MNAAEYRSQAKLLLESVDNLTMAECKLALSKLTKAQCKLVLSKLKQAILILQLIPENELTADDYDLMSTIEDKIVRNILITMGDNPKFIESFWEAAEHFHSSMLYKQASLKKISQDYSITAHDAEYLMKAIENANSLVLALITLNPDGNYYINEIRDDVRSLLGCALTILQEQLKLAAYYSKNPNFSDLIRPTKAKTRWTYISDSHHHAILFTPPKRKAEDVPWIEEQGVKQQRTAEQKVVKSAGQCQKRRAR